MTTAASLRRLLRGLPMLLLVAAPLALITAQRARPVPAVAHTVEVGELKQEVFGRGALESRREAALGFDLSGRLAEVMGDEGQRVGLGQELARLSIDQARADLQAATSGVAASRTALGRLAAEASRAEVSLQAAARERARMQALVADGVMAQSELDAALDRERLARAELDRVSAQRVEATRAIDVARSSAGVREATIARATLLAPFDGVITRRLREPGDTVGVGATVLRLVDVDDLWARAWIDESALAALAEGQAASITLPDGRVLPARVSRVGVEADRQTHEVLVDVAPEQALGRVAVGQRADVWITLKVAQQAVLLPLAFLQREPATGELFVTVAEGERIGRRAVRLGVMGREAAQVVEGLSEGDVVLRAVKPGAALPLGRRWGRP